MSITLLQGDCREMLQTLPEKSIQTVVTSPPYYGLRKYSDDPREIGQEATPAEYVAALIEVFRQVRRVLRDDGTVWLNLGDSYSGSWGNYGGQNRGNGTQRAIVKGSLPSPGYDGRESERPASSVTPNIANCIQASIEGHSISLRGRCALTIAAESQDVLADNQALPYSKFSRLFGVQRIFLKQGNDDLCEVFHLLDAECGVWIGLSVAFSRVGVAGADLVVNVSDNLRIVVADNDLDRQAPLGVAVPHLTTVDTDMPLAVEKTSEPIAECIGDLEPAGDAVAIDSSGESLLQVDAVNQSVAFGDTFVSGTSGLRNFRITKTSEQHFALALCGDRVDLRVGAVAHVFVSNEYGSLVRYAELYDKAKRLSNRLQSKQLIGIPWMVVTALQEDGWILRSDCIWSKPNCMPESVTDRPTRAHEYVFLLAKSARYFYDAAAIAEPSITGDARKPYAPGQVDKRGNGHDRNGGQLRNTPDAGTTRNRRTVWSIATQPYSGAHYATMPEALIAPCILAGSSAQACEHCGAAWVRVVERESDVVNLEEGRRQATRSAGAQTGGTAKVTLGVTEHVRRRDLGFAPSCACPDNTGSAASVVLDPFGGSGTVGRVAARYQRNAVLIELNQQYIEEHVEKRTNGLQVEMFV